MRFAPHLAALLMGAAALAGCSTMGATMGAMTNGMAGTTDKTTPTDKAAAATRPAPPTNDIDGNVRQAQLLRLAGNYDEAIHTLSQLMLVAADDPHVVAEYGKSLAMKGRASEATQFLRRAVELSSNDWTLYSALGVSYDQMGDAVNARAAYEHALALKPNEAGVLNNYAMSRMLANDPQNAKILIARAEAVSGGLPDEKIARNQALIEQMAPDGDAPKPEALASAQKSAPTTTKTATAQAPAKPATAAAKPAPKLASSAPAPAPKPAPQAAPAPAPSGPQNANDVARLLASQPVVADAAPRPLAPQPVVPSGVVMQAVPYDPYAGPVVKLHPPKAVAKAQATSNEAVAKADAPKATTKPKPVVNADANAKANPADQKPAKTAQVPSLRVVADKY